MYMVGGSSESKVVRGKLNLVRLKLFQLSTSVERKLSELKIIDIVIGDVEEKCDFIGIEVEENSIFCNNVVGSYLLVKDVDILCQFLF